MQFPQHLQYTPEHEWVDTSVEGSLRFGITDFAQDALGDVVFVSLPAPGEELTAGQPCGEVESTKSVSDLFAPVSGRVTAINMELDTAPELVNTDPYGRGWMVEVALAAGEQVAGFLSADDYRAQAGA